MTPEQLDAWRWAIALALAPPPHVSGFDPKKVDLSLNYLSLVIAEYRRLVVEGAQPVASGSRE